MLQYGPISWKRFNLYFCFGLNFFPKFQRWMKKTNIFKCRPPAVHFTIRNRVPYNKLLTNLAFSSRTGEYWPSVVFVRTAARSVARSALSRPRANIPQYGPRARLVSGCKYQGMLGLSYFLLTEIVLFTDCDVCRSLCSCYVKYDLNFTDCQGRGLNTTLLSNSSFPTTTQIL